MFLGRRIGLVILARGDKDDVRMANERRVALIWNIISVIVNLAILDNHKYQRCRQFAMHGTTGFEPTI